MTVPADSQWQHPVPREPKKHGPSFYILIVLAVVVVVVPLILFLGCSAIFTGALVGSADGSASAWDDSASGGPSSSAKAKVKVDGVRDGMHRVGSEIDPGRYRTKVPADSLCYWERLKDASGDLDGIIANENVDGGQVAYVTVKKTDKYFKTDDCGTWVKVG